MDTPHGATDWTWAGFTTRIGKATGITYSAGDRGTPWAIGPNGGRHRRLIQLPTKGHFMLVHDLTHPDFDPPDCPTWAKESLPDHMLPYRGRNGMPDVYRQRTYPLAMTVRGIDRYHANQFVNYRPETADYLYSTYTPLVVSYQRGTLPSIEALSADYTRDCRTPREIVLALLHRAMQHFKHPDGPPCGSWVPGDRNLDDEALLATGSGWCNEQARVFVRLCQVNQIPARLVHTFYADNKSGHCIVECHVENRWCMVDPTWLCVFPDSSGHWLSAAECHDRGAGQLHCGQAYFHRFAQLVRLSDEQMNFTPITKAARWREEMSQHTPRSLADKMNVFSIINYPLPR